MMSKYGSQKCKNKYEKYDQKSFGQLLFLFVQCAVTYKIFGAGILCDLKIISRDLVKNLIGVL